MKAPVGKPTTPTEAEVREFIGSAAIERSVPVPMRDGVELIADVYLPARHDGNRIGAPAPTIIERTPYDRQRTDLYLTACFFAARGYAYVLQDCRGRYESGGDFSFQMNALEHLDGYDTVEWIAEQEWSDGQVATTGISFTGANQQALATERPPHLATQVILDAGFNYWAQSVRCGGAFSEGVHLPYAIWMALSGHEARADPAVRATLAEALENIEDWLERRPLKRGDSPLAAAPTYEAWYFELAEHGDYDGTWRDALPSLEANVDRYPDIPVCLVSGWYGHHATGNLAKYQALARRNQSMVKLVVGPWLHTFDYMQQSSAGEIELGIDAARNLNDFRLRWFDHWLRGIDTGIEDEPAIDYFVMGGGDGRRLPDGKLFHGGRWERTPVWPPAGTSTRKLYLKADGGLDPDPPSDADSSTPYTFDPQDPVPTVGGAVQPPLGEERMLMYAGGYDQRGRAELPLCRDELPLASRHDVLVFRTPPLEKALKVSGPLACKLWVSSSAPDTDFTVKLVDEYPASADYPAGFALNLCDTIVRMRYRNGRTSAELIVPGEIYELEVEVPTVSNVFAAGHFLRLDISSSNAPRFDVNPNTGGKLGRSTGWQTARNAVYHEGERASHLVLSIAGE
jgi:putative CocE/NonD family hydrolase